MNENKENNLMDTAADLLMQSMNTLQQGKHKLVEVAQKMKNVQNLDVTTTENKTQYQVNIPTHGFQPTDITVNFDEAESCLQVQLQHTDDKTQQKRLFFYKCVFKQPVIKAKITATLENEQLKLVLPKAAKTVPEPVTKIPIQ